MNFFLITFVTINNLHLLTMVNVENFAERLNIIMDYYELTSAMFADKIEVQRSSISHILSGRNKPSLDFVLKILKEFPEVELYWLLNGIGSFPKSEHKQVEKTHPLPSTLFSEADNSEKEIKKVEAQQIIKTDFDPSKDIDRIVVFYKDGTFKNYIAE